MKTCVVYYSQTGNTKKIAEAMGEALGCSAFPVNDARIESDADMVFVGGAVYATQGHSVHPSIAQFADKLKNSGFKGKVAVFGTGFSQSNVTGILRDIFRSRGMKVEQESFFCNGRFMLFMHGHPDMKDVAMAKDFAKKTEALSKV
jgi:flavodoxin